MENFDIRIDCWKIDNNGNKCHNIPTKKLSENKNGKAIGMVWKSCSEHYQELIATVIPYSESGDRVILDF